MNNGHQAPAQPPPSMKGHDVLYVLFRHKWLIILLSIAGLAGGGAVYYFAKPSYFSEADLLVKYIVENRSVSADDAAASIRTPREDNVVNAEIGILSSMDLAKEVAQAVGATNLVPKVDPRQDPTTAAASAIRRGLEVGTRGKSTILNIRFQHEDPVIARSVLTNLVAAYLRMHSRIHRPPDFLNDLQKESDQRRSALDQVADELRRIKNELKVSSVDDAKRAFQEEITRTRREISVAETLLAEKQAALVALVGVQAKPVEPTNEAPAGTNATAPSAALATTNSIPPDRVAEYRGLRLRIEELRKREQTLLLEYTDLSPFVQAVRQRIETNEASLAKLVSQFPLLEAPATAARLSDNAVQTSQTPSPALEIPAIEARLKSLNSQLDKLRADALRLDEREADLETLTRRKQIEEKRYLHLATALGQAGVDEALTQGRSANISVIQHPTPAAPAQSAMVKIAGGLAGGGLALALVLAFGYELFLDQSLRRRAQVENSLRVPVFLTIPRLHLPKRSKTRKALPAARGTGDSAKAPEGATESVDGNGRAPHSAPTGTVEQDSALTAYVEALRDRLIMHFESEGLERKPKLVGLTSCGHGSGVTTLATSLAASLSETGDGNVLYVDMNPQRGPSILPFKRGESKVALAQAFEGDARAAAQVQDNLYVVSLSEPGSRRVGVVPKTLAALMPKMKASDYDYIIFDFPPVTQTSVTAKVTGLLDVTFLVLESEQTHADLARNALKLMGEGRAKVSAVLNKHRRYIPRQYDPDL